MDTTTDMEYSSPNGDLYVFTVEVVANENLQMYSSPNGDLYVFTVKLLISVKHVSVCIRPLMGIYMFLHTMNDLVIKNAKYSSPNGDLYVFT